MGLCILCSVLASHGADDEASGRYSVQNFAPASFASGSSSSGNITLTPGAARMTLTGSVPTVIVSATSASPST